MRTSSARRISLASLGFEATMRAEGAGWVVEADVDQATLDAAVAAAPVDVSDQNRGTITDRLTADLAVIDSIAAAAPAEFTQQGLRDLQRQVKDLARVDKRLIRLVLGRTESTE